MEVFRRFCRWLYRKVYDDEIVVDPGEIERLREMSKSSALIFIPSHKSNFDHLIMYYLLFSEGFPPPHTAAGANMSFFPMSRILPRTGAYFIRRSFQNDPVYKEALAGFMNYLVQRRFHQEFFIEGGRTRSGKQLPPRYGMLRYIVEGVRAQRRDGRALRARPRLTYDQMLEVDEYVRQERRRGPKEARELRLPGAHGPLAARPRASGACTCASPSRSRWASTWSARDDQRLLVEKLAFQHRERDQRQRAR